MANDNMEQNKTEPVNWLVRIGRKIAFADYERVEHLQRALTQKLYHKSAGHIEAAILKRSAAIKLWYGIIPLLFVFIPLWVVFTIPLFIQPQPRYQFIMILCAIILSGICYLLTFYNDGVRFKINLAHVRQNLLSAFEPAGLLPMLPSTKQEAITLIPTPKGSIPLLLLNELVRKEAGYSNVFNAPIDEVIPFYKKLIGFNEKNFKKMLSQYRRKQDIILNQENARTTHNGYLDILIRYYNAIGETELERQAIALQIFLNQTTQQIKS